MLRLQFASLFGSEQRLGRARYQALFKEFLRDFRESLDGDKRQQERAERRQERAFRPGRPAPSRDGAGEDTGPSRRKQLYRQLARRLHPDHNTALTPREKELWHEALAAYDANDLDRLETLLAVTESPGAEAKGFLGIKSLARLRAIAQDLGRKLKAAQKALREAKTKPSWDFPKTEQDPRSLGALQRKISAEMEAASSELEEGIWELEERVAEWKDTRKGQKRRSRGSHRPRSRASTAEMWEILFGGD